MQWLNIRNVNSADRSADIYINGQIGQSWYDENAVAAADFIKTVNALGELDVINLFINSPGGSVSDGTAIHNYLKRHQATVNVEILGEASSIASVIAMAGDIINMPANAIMMIHDPMQPMSGFFNSKQLKALADKLDSVRDAILTTYTNRTGKGDEEIKSLMQSEKVMTGKEAVELGFADNVLDELDALACTDKDKLQEMFTNLADKSAKELIASIPAPEPAPVNLHEFAMTACNKAGFAQLASDMVDNCKTAEQITARVALATNVQNVMVAAELGEHSNEVMAHLSDPAKMISAAVNAALANQEHEHITVPEDVENSGAAVINHREIYQNRNKKR